MKSFFGIGILVLVCSCANYVYVYHIPEAVGKMENIRLAIEPFGDKTGNYSESYSIENRLAGCINNEFVGFYVQNTRHNIPPTLHEMPNPFHAVTDTNGVDDIRIEGSIETMYYGHIDYQVVSDLGLMVSLIEDASNKFQSLISVRTSVYNSSTGELILDELISGASTGNIKDVTQYELFSQAIDNYCVNVLTKLSTGEY